MVFQHLNRRQRREARASAAQAARKQPEVLTAIPREGWPRDALGDRRTHFWRSRTFFAQMFTAERFQGIDTRIVSVCRATLLPSGKWADGITWEELMQVKREIGFGDWYGLEVFPRDEDIVNLDNMRHLWLLAKPLLGIGWILRPEEKSAVARRGGRAPLADLVEIREHGRS